MEKYFDEVMEAPLLEETWEGAYSKIQIQTHHNRNKMDTVNLKSGETVEMHSYGSHVSQF